MDFIAEMKGTVKLDHRYENFHKGLRDIMKFENKDVFMLGVVLGYKHNRYTEKFEGGGIEVRPVYLSKDDRSILYSIAYDIHGEDFLTNVGDKEFQRELFQLFFKYSNGGMDILYEEVFKDNMTEGQFRKNYLEYDNDLLKYMYQTMVEAPF